MNISITSNSSKDYPYRLKMYDGPDGIDELDAVCKSLGECFEQAIRFRMEVAMSYK